MFIGFYKYTLILMIISSTIFEALQSMENNQSNSCNFLSARWIKTTDNFYFCHDTAFR